MGNKKNITWTLILYTNPQKTEIFKIIRCESICEMGFYLNLNPNSVSNYFHKLVKPRGVLKLCDITQHYKTGYLAKSYLTGF